MKCSRAHSSAMLFWMGVPLSSSRFRQANPSFKITFCSTYYQHTPENSCHMNNSREGLAFGEPVVEMGLRVEEGGHDEVQQRPQLRHVVLDGCPTQQQPVPAGKALQGFPPYAAAALDRLQKEKQTFHHWNGGCTQQQPVPAGKALQGFPPYAAAGLDRMQPETTLSSPGFITKPLQGFVSNRGWGGRARGREEGNLQVVVCEIQLSSPC
jgi:hypothetical protein